MIIKEEHLEGNSHIYLKECLHWLTTINNTRLYWLWMRFFIMSGASVGWTDFSTVLSIFSTMRPITDALSWGIFGSRVVMQSILEIQRTFQTAEVALTSLTKISCLNDFLWGTSNFLSVQWLHSNELRPSVATPGWWGNLCMEILLVSDVIFAAWQFRHEQRQTKESVILSQERQVHWQYKKQVLLSNLAYSISLACGFFLFQGFSTPINNILPPYVGTSLCVFSVCLFRAIEWTLLLSKFKNKEPLLTANAKGSLQKMRVGAILSGGIDLLLPFFIWISSNEVSMLLVIVLSLSANILINGFFKRDEPSQLGRFSLFASHPSLRDPQTSFAKIDISPSNTLDGSGA